jgi:FKBP-type peptidyl-prolyl cis-trans isomerase FkpA
LKGIRVLGLFVTAVLSAITVKAQQKGFKTDAATGVQYRFIKHDAKGANPVEGNVVRVSMLWTAKNAKGNGDTVYRDSHLKGFGDSLGTIPIALKKSFNGCLEQGIMMMAKGDSAVFRIKGDSLFLKTFGCPPDKLPHAINGNTIFTFSIKLVSFQTQQEAMAEKQAEMQKRMAKSQARKGQEATDIATYLKKNNLNITPDADSIFYLQTTKGTGPQVKEGDSLEVKYTGMFLDGNVFDKSDRGTGKGTFPVIYSKHVSLIQGWISVLGKMNEGDKVRVLIPSKMGYGARGMGQIQPYTPLIFDMEIVSLKPGK